MRELAASLALVAALSLSACGEGAMISRGAGVDGPSVAGFVKAAGGKRMVVVPVAYDVEKINVLVPHFLRVSEANSFVPRADIVWHGDTLGDRYAQVTALIAEAAANGTKAMTIGQQVEVDIEITRFHALTPKARYTTGGNFATHFLLTVRDLATGEILDGPRPVVADTWASGGQRAMEEEAAGITQKMVIEAKVARVLSHELSQKLVPAEDAPTSAVSPIAVSHNDFTPGMATLGE